MKFQQARPKNKYGAKKTEFGGIVFASKAEAKRYAELVILQRAGQIVDLKCQPKFPLHVEGVLVGNYVADFSYFTKTKPEMIVEDVKSPATKTSLYRLKAKLVRAIHGITILEVMLK